DVSLRCTAAASGSSPPPGRVQPSPSRFPCASSGWHRPHEPPHPPDRGSRGQPSHRARSLDACRLRGDRGAHGGGWGVDGRLASPGPHPDGHPAPGAGWLRGHAADQGQPGAPSDSHHRRHLVCPERRRHQGARGRLRRLRDQALQPPRAPRQDPRVRAVRTPPRILIADDNAMNLDILQTRLAAHGYDVVTATAREAPLAEAPEPLPVVTLRDAMLPKPYGPGVCARLRADVTLPFMPIILVTARTDPKDVVAGLEAGGDEYLTKPVDQSALVARVKSMLRIKAPHDTVREQGTRVGGQAGRDRRHHRPPRGREAR